MLTTLDQDTGKILTTHYIHIIFPGLPEYKGGKG